jgi:predicted small lipoprotein YifL
MKALTSCLLLLALAACGGGGDTTFAPEADARTLQKDEAKAPDASAR